MPTVNQACALSGEVMNKDKSVEIRIDGRLVVYGTKCKSQACQRLIKVLEKYGIEVDKDNTVFK